MTRPTCRFLSVFHTRAQFTVLNALFILALACGFNQAFSQSNPGFQRCIADQFLSEGIELDPRLKTNMQQMENLLQQKIRSGEIAEARSTIVIPVVFHLVWNSAEQNISDLQIYDQLEILNRAFNMNNRNLHTVPVQFRSLISNIQIEFCLAARDPDGNPTNGITRTFTPTERIGNERIDFIRRAIHFSEHGGVDHWDPDRYLNIWVCEIGSGILGNSTFPGGPPYPESEGIIVDYRYLGSIGTAVASKPYDGGKTLVHEIGHYFNLFHPWGPGSGSCEVDDFVEDTPLQTGPYFSCNDSDRFSCGSEDIVSNFMDYPEDDCLAMFTHGQRERMISSLITFRQPLLESDACIPPSGSEPNPANESDIKMAFLSGAQKIGLYSEAPGNFSGRVELYDLSGRLVFEEQVDFEQVHLIESAFLLPGVYIVCFRQEKVFSCSKIAVY